MDRSSEFLKGKGLFGSYPTQDSVKELEKNGVRYFFDLTCKGEKKIKKYTTNYVYYNYPIVDNSVPTNWQTFAQFILKIANTIKSLHNEEYIYVHCRGGHGRAGIVVACLLCHLKKIPASEAISQTTMYHNLRIDLKEKWKKVGSPQTRSQKRFIGKFFEPIYIYYDREDKDKFGYSYRYKHFSSNFSNAAPISVIIKNFGMFPNAEAAFQSFKDSSNNDYVKRLELCKNYGEAIDIGSEIDNTVEWNNIRNSVMYKIINAKFNQHEEIKNNLLNTGLRHILVYSDDIYWGIIEGNKNGQESKNMMGKILEKLRKKLYLNMNLDE